MSGKSFTLMNKRRPLIDFTVDYNKGTQRWEPDAWNVLCELPEVMRYKLKTWFIERISPSDRLLVHKVLSDLDLDDGEAYLEYTRAISLTDTLWVNSHMKPVRWEEINPYRNKLSRVLGNLCLYGGRAAGQTPKTPSPSFGVDGNLSKAWEYIDGEICLVKNGGIFNPQEPTKDMAAFIEYYASQVVEAVCGGNPELFVRYTLRNRSTVNGTVVDCIGRSFTNEQFGYMPFGASTVTLSVEELVTKYNSQVFRAMLLSDALVLNVDRHTGNYGFLMSNDTMDVVKVAPIFDFDWSLGWRVPLYSGSIVKGYETAIEDKSYNFNKADFISQGRFVLDKTLRERLGFMRPFRFKRPTTGIDLTDNRVEYMEYIVNTQIGRILA